MRLTSRSVVVVAAFVLLGLWWQGAEGQETGSSLVVFIQDESLQTGSVFSDAPEAYTRLAAMFTSLGADVIATSLAEPLPEDAEVVVLVGAARPLPVDHLARLWLHIVKGNHLLVATDPTGHLNGRSDGATSGISQLLTLEYGVSLLDGFLTEPWFTRESINQLQTVYMRVYPEELIHPVTEPLVRYGVTVDLWGARHLHVEPFGIDSQAAALLYTESSFAETQRDAINADSDVPLTLNIGEDAQGRLFVGALGVNSRFESRIAVLADSQMLQDGFGLGDFPETDRPLHPGNQLLAQRLVGWLLGVSAENWLQTLPGLSWVAIDGDRSDWEPLRLLVATDEVDDTNIRPLDIQQAQAFRNDQFLYVLVETAVSAGLDAQVELNLDSDFDGIEDTLVVANTDGVAVRLADGEGGGSEDVIPDGALAIGDVIEVRVPLRVAGISSRIPELCLTSARDLAFPPPPDCIPGVIEIRELDEPDPNSLRFPTQLLVTVDTVEFINLRAEPRVDSTILTTYPNGIVLAAVGRTDESDWIQVQNGRFLGWISSDLLAPNGDIELLPVIG